MEEEKEVTEYLKPQPIKDNKGKTFYIIPSFSGIPIAKRAVDNIDAFEVYTKPYVTDGYSSEVGYITFERGEDYAYILFFGLEDKWQGRGIGKKLLVYTLKFLKDTGIDLVKLKSLKRIVKMDDEDGQTYDVDMNYVIYTSCGFKLEDDQFDEDQLMFEMYSSLKMRLDLRKADPSNLPKLSIKPHEYTPGAIVRSTMKK